MPEHQTELFQSIQRSDYRALPQTSPKALGSKAYFNFNWERLAARRSLTGKAGQRHHEMIAGRGIVPEHQRSISRASNEATTGANFGTILYGIGVWGEGANPL